MKKELVWRYTSLFIVVALLLFFIAGFGKPLLTAFVISEEDSVVLVDTELELDLITKSETRAAIKLKEFEGIKKRILDSEEDIRGDIGEDKINYEAEDFFSADIDKEKLESLSKNPSVSEIKKVREISAFLQDSAIITNATKTWTYQINSTNITGEGETICVIDTGINFSHNDLSGKNPVCNIDCISSASCVENCSISDDHGHGTFVSGISSANGGLLGIAKDADLIGVKVLNYEGTGYEDDLKMGIDWCIDNSDTYNISVISLSLGTDSIYTDYCDNTDDIFNITSSIDSAFVKNISIIAASGNQGSSTGIASPACIENAIAVGGVNKNDVISYNRNSLIDIVAPGVSINSTSINGGYSLDSGTSSATPHVSGAFALLNQFYKLQNSTSVNTEISIIENSLQIRGQQVNDSSSNLSYYRINIYSSMLFLGGIIEPTATEGFVVNLLSPSEEHHINYELADFSCGAATNNNSINISNVTFYIWNSSSSIIYNEMVLANSSGNLTIMQANFSYNFSNHSQETYYWNCLAYNNENNNTFSNPNYSITYDTTTPQLTLTAPAESSTINTNITPAPIYLYFNVNDNIGISNCLVILNGANVGSVTNLTEPDNSYLNYLSAGAYTWRLNCSDYASNSNISETRQFTVSYTAPPSGDDGGDDSGDDSESGGGGDDSGDGEEIVFTIYELNDIEIQDGYTGEYEVLDEIKFNIDKSGERILYTVKINAIGGNTTRVTVSSVNGSSDTIVEVLEMSEEKKH